MLSHRRSQARMAAAGQLRLLLLAGLCTSSLPSVPHLAVGADRALPALREPALAETIAMPPGMRRPPPLPPAAATPGAGYARPGGVSSPIHRLNSQVWGDSSTVSRASPLSCLACSPVGWPAISVWMSQRLACRAPARLTIGICSLRLHAGRRGEGGCGELEPPDPRPE